MITIAIRILDKDGTVLAFADTSSNTRPVTCFCTHPGIPASMEYECMDGIATADYTIDSPNEELLVGDYITIEPMDDYYLKLEGNIQ